MGIFDFFKKREAASKIEVRNSIPVITTDKDMFKCFDEVFERDFTKVQGLSKSETEKIHSIIKFSGGGFLDFGSYHNRVYEEYFKGRAWVWPEYEEWNNVFVKMKSFPMNFPQIKIKEISSEDVFNELKVLELKEFLKNNSVSIPEKSKKKDLVELAGKIEGVEKTTIWIEKKKEIDGRLGRAIYEVLMRTIAFRAKGLFDRRRAESIGVKKFKLVLVYEQDRVFVDMALKKDKSAIPPLFPSDLSMYEAIIPGFD